MPPQNPQPKRKQSSLERKTELILRARNIPFTAEYRFHPTRKWRFDFALVEHKIAIEIDGGLWTNGRHVRPDGYIKQNEKQNEAVKLGWKVLRYHGGIVNKEPLKIVADILELMENYSYDLFNGET